jgi:Condensation domain/TubC N-terminal docking domain
MIAKSVTDILFTLRSRGIRVWADNGRLRYQTPKGTLTLEEIDSLRSMREQILTLLQRSASIPKAAQLTARQPSDPVPLTFSQQLWWDFWNLEKRPSMRSVAAAVRLRGRLSIDALQESVERLVQRHEALRTRVSVVGGMPRQQIDEAGKYRLDVIDLTPLPHSDREIEAQRLAEQLVHEPVFLTVGPLFAVRLLKLDTFDHVLVIATEHAISDAASIGIIWRDTFCLYTQSIRGHPCPLPKIAVQFADYAVWQRKTHHLWMEQHGGYWKQRLAGAGRVRLSPKEKVAETAGAKWATLPIRFGKILSEGLLETSRREHTSLVMSVLTAFVAAVLRSCNTTSLTFPFTTAGRLYPEVENTIGFFGTQLFLRVDLLEEDSLVDLLRRATKEYATAYAHDDSCRVALQMRRPEFMFNPPFNWIPQQFNMNPDGSGHELQTDSLTMTQYKIAITPRDDQEWDGEPRIDLSDSKDGVVGEIGYRADRFASDTIERFRRNLLLFAASLVKEPNTRVKALAYEP